MLKEDVSFTLNYTKLWDAVSLRLLVCFSPVGNTLHGAYTSWSSPLVL